MSQYTSIFDAYFPPKAVMKMPMSISALTMSIWLAAGTITETDRGEENIYLTDQFGNEFCCKCL